MMGGRFFGKIKHDGVEMVVFVQRGFDADTAVTMKNQSPAGIPIVDDHPMVREGLAGRIAGEAGLEICGEAADTDEVLDCVAPGGVAIDAPCCVTLSRMYVIEGDRCRE